MVAKVPVAEAHVFQNRESTERGRLYDILVFILFGLLIVLAMHEIAALGEVIGRNRAGAASAARRAFSYNHRPIRF
jgi:predicted membrane channel-forming protein YqfA (hemolysin III family)